MTECQRPPTHPSPFQSDGPAIGGIPARHHFRWHTELGNGLWTGFRFAGAPAERIGKALIRQGLSRLKDMNAHGCCLVGHPDYYRKFGFENVPGLGHEGVPAEVFFALSFDGHVPQGTVSFHEGFKADGHGEDSDEPLRRG